MANISKLQVAIIAAVAIVFVAAIGGVTHFSDNTLNKNTIIPEAQAQVGPVDAMMEITNQVVNNLTTATGGYRELQLENIRQAESLVFGKPVILMTNGVPDTFTISVDYDIMAADLKAALLSCADPVSTICFDGFVKSEAKELGDRITYWQETKHNLELQTTITTCDVLAPATCVQLDLGDEPQAVGPGINVGTDKIWDGWYREVRSPYAIVEPLNDWGGPFGPQGKFIPSENIISVGPLAIDECSTVIKEIQGIKVIQRPVKIPIWQEPWTSRASIIGFNTVWVVDFIPAEFVKSLNYCNHAGLIDFDYTIDVIIERELTHFWKFLPGGIPSGMY